ncbi:Piso0_005450 [Millerozyma farinosa CBS 7064]|uniref:Piso0_005450 protein n=1 Tax=Pichia sorbitophila (strain ATCC MYA-4447 / BCRC 22081 / CBS 7064 / NBRC 10061 / NRRL Y-12695) TaxID=559304 RepID=G8XZ18_PICSO|nr:Piso0_005450 [Millerozyma farinosa CBS 7064]
MQTQADFQQRRDTNNEDKDDASNFLHKDTGEGIEQVTDKDSVNHETSEVHDSTDEQDEPEDGNPAANHSFSNKRIILQRFTVYNSQSTMYIVGSNAKESLFRILEINKDVDDESKLQIIEDKNFFYTRKDMVELIKGLSESIEGGIHKIAHGFGLLGLIKFTKGYYLCIITKCSQVAILGGHYIYHIDETKLIPLDITYQRPDKYSDEEKLLSIFKYLDLGKTFYFSYAYDVTNTLQTNFLRNKKLATEFQYNIDLRKSPIYPDIFDNFEHNERFVWNKHLLRPITQNPEIAAYEWFQPIIHGFVDQANISIYGKKIYITIIARRSHHFAGARFLKRGVNDKGNVANEVETEQIVSDMLISSFHDTKHGFFNNPRYTSFVQHRGSIPLYWSQDLNRLPKPPIEIHLSDPFYQSSAIHFNNLFKRYGAPVIILNLIKTKEKQARESKLNQHFKNCISYLNQFLLDSDEQTLQYYSFDMSKHSKKHLDVIKPLQNIALQSIDQIGFFHNGTDLASTKIQKGIIRTNCIDCLDRTNAAQFIICKEALSHQLSSLGLKSESASLDYDSDLINILTEMFHDHGDTIAVQYGGSNLVNTMDSYRRINQWSSHTRDILNSIKRIYSNSFMDSIRQEAINLFLGNYQYSRNKPKLWELENDFYLHNDTAIDDVRIKRSYIHWYNQYYLQNDRFFFSLMDPREIPYPDLKLDPFPDYNDNWFNECYVPRKYQSLGELFQFNMNSNSRYFPSVVTNDDVKKFDYSPFKSRRPYLQHKNEAYVENSKTDLEEDRDKGILKDKQANEGRQPYMELPKISNILADRTRHNDFTSLSYNSQSYKLKNFFVNKIEKFGYSKNQNPKGKNMSYGDHFDKFNKREEDLFAKEKEPKAIDYTKPEIKLADLDIYTRHCDAATIVNRNVFLSKPNKIDLSFSVNKNDLELYEQCTLDKSSSSTNDERDMLELKSPSFTPADCLTFFSNDIFSPYTFDANDDYFQ